MKKILFFGVVIAGLLLQNTAFAEKTNLGGTFPSLGRGIRPLGMGNAFLTMKGTDENVLFYNPAAIRDYSNDTKFVTGLPVGQTEVNWSVIQLVKDTFDFQDDLSASGTASGDIDVFRTFVNEHIGKFYDLELRMPIAGAYNRYFAVGIISDNKFGVSFRNRSFPNFEIKARGVAGPVFGTAIGLFEDRLEIGVAGKVLYAAENEQIVTTSDILVNEMDDFKWANWKRGLGAGADIGIKYEIIDYGVNWMDFLKPTIAATYQDVGDTRFFTMKKNGGPEKIPQTISAGIGFHPQFGVIQTSAMFDFREINIKEDLMMKLNGGVEVRFPKYFGIRPSLRGGMNQGYPTGGAGLEFGDNIIWNVAYFGKETGQNTRQKAAYRIANELTFRF